MGVVCAPSEVGVGGAEVGREEPELSGVDPKDDEEPISKAEEDEYEPRVEDSLDCEVERRVEDVYKEVVLKTELDDKMVCVELDELESEVPDTTDDILELHETVS